MMILGNKHILSLFYFVSFVLFIASCETAFSTTESLSSHRQDIYNNAALAYREGNYQNSYGKYLSLVNQDIVSADLFYNLGNVCTQLKNTGEATLWYERARLLRPRDNDIRANLKKVAPYNIDGESMVLSRPFIELLHYFTFGEWAIIFSACIILFGIIVFLDNTVTRFTGKCKFVYHLSWILSIVLLAFIISSFYYTIFRQYAIVTAPNTALKSGPGENFNNLTVLPSGEKVEVLKFNDPKWNHISVIDGSAGFIPREAIIAIYPYKQK